MTLIKTHSIFAAYKVYGPYLAKVKGRYHVVLKHNNGTKTTMPYSRFVWVNAHGVHPEPGFDIDHINGDRLDNRLENLQCIKSEENNQKYHASLATRYVHLRCPWCEVEFVRPHANTHLGYGKSERGTTYSCCSKSCATRIQHKYKGYARLEFEGNVIRIFTAAPTTYEAQHGTR